MTATTGYDSNVVARGLELLLVENDPRKSYSHFSSAIEGHESLTLREEERNKSIQFRDVAGSVLIRMELENGDNFAKLGRYGSALEAYSSIRSSSTVPIMVQFQMKNNAGACLARLGRKEEALAMQLKAFTLNPSGVKTLKNIAILLADLGYHEEAIVAFDGYLKIHPESYSALCGKAGCLKDLRLYSKSEIIAEQAQLLDPQLLRGRCAHDLRKFCHEELSKSKHSKKDIPVVESKLPPLVSYFSISTSHIHNTEFNFEAWLASVQSTFGDTNIYEDFRLPHTDGNGTQFNNILEGQQVVLSPETKYEDKATLFAVRIPGQEMVVNSTPIKQDTKLIDQRWPTDKIPKGTAITSRTDMAQEKNPSNQPAHIMRQESIPSRVPHVMHQTLRPATSILSQPRIPTTFIGSGATFASINDPVVKMKYPISLGIRKETDGPVINPSRRETSEAWMRSPLSHSMYAQISRRLEAPGKYLSVRALHNRGVSVY